jgi:hypothetical protein
MAVAQSAVDCDTKFSVKDEVAVLIDGQWCGAIITKILENNKIQVI